MRLYTACAVQLAGIDCDPAVSGVEVTVAECDYTGQEVLHPNSPALQRLSIVRPSIFSPGQYMDLAKCIMGWPGAPVLRVRVTKLA